MKKGLFNKQYGLLSAVLDERKEQTRRICKNQTNPSIEEAKWKVGEVIAVAECYEDVAGYGGDVLANMMQDETTFKEEYCGAGWHNAMFVRADLMPHRIKITNIRIERLQDISDEDCLKEGLHKMDNPIGYASDCVEDRYAKHWWFHTPREAFADLIDKVSGKGTWESNPYVFVYDFELVK